MYWVRPERDLVSGCLSPFQKKNLIYEPQKPNRVSELLFGALSPVNRKGLHQGWRRFSQRDVLLKGPIRQKEDRKNRVRKRRVVGRIYWMKYSWKGLKDRNRQKNRIKTKSREGFFISNYNVRGFHRVSGRFCQRRRILSPVTPKWL